MPVQRRLPNWIDGYLKYIRNSESPISYHQWAAISCIAAALQRRVNFPWGHSVLYPNLYVILVGPSGKARKSDPLVITGKLLKECSISFLPEATSGREAIARNIRQAMDTYKDKSTNIIKTQYAVSGLFEELVAFTGYQNRELLAWMTNWYDSRDAWTYDTKHQGKDSLNGVCFNMLASTAPNWIPHILTPEATGGGFTSRCIFVVEHRKAKSVADPNENMPGQTEKEALIHDLQLIRQMTGKYQFSMDARETYKQWYLDEDAKQAAATSAIHDPALDGYASRRADLIKKVGMCLSASRGDDMIVHKKDFEQALALLVEAEKGVSYVFQGVGKSRYASEQGAILRFIQDRQRVTKAELLSVFARDLDETSFSTIIKTLSSMQKITIEIDPSRGVSYVAR